MWLPPYLPVFDPCPRTFLNRARVSPRRARARSREIPVEALDAAIWEVTASQDARGFLRAPVPVRHADPIVTMNAVGVDGADSGASRFGQESEDSLGAGSGVLFGGWP